MWAHVRTVAARSREAEWPPATGAARRRRRACEMPPVRPTFAVEFIPLCLHPVQVVLLLAAQELQLLYFGPVIGPQPLARRHQGALGAHGYW